MLEKRVTEDPGSLFHSHMQSTLIYVAVCWAMRMEDKRKLKTIKMIMLLMLCGKTLKNKIRNDKMRTMTGMEGRSIEEFLLEQRLRWLGHVERIDK